MITGAGVVPWRRWSLSDCCIVSVSMALEWELCEYTVSPDCGDWLLLVMGWEGLVYGLMVYKQLK